MLALGGSAARSATSLQNQIASARTAAGDLRAQIESESRRIEDTAGGLAAARRRLDSIQTDLDARVAALRRTQGALLTSRNRLIALENRLHVATGALAANLRASYEGASPDLMTVILNAHGFGSLLEQVGFMARVAHQDATIVGLTRAARSAVRLEADRLGALEARDRVQATAVLRRRNEVAGLQAALLRVQSRQLAARAQTTVRYHAVNGRLGVLQRRAAAAAAAAARAAARAAAAVPSGNAGVAGISINTGGMVQPPPGAPPAVARVIAAANAIATLPYVWGGGHGSFQANGYDCSGSISYALAAGGLLSSPLVSGAFESWGAPGPGRWITVYANAGHAWMEVAGWRFDTVALATGGTRWSQGGGEFSGFVVRHPPGL
ncbi:MAG TPA: hypothetical protein VFN55_01955 [Solirubrobacteraceae bacterium]|nr:hypothetical protein [Solirubrobacteraceae bacterium]